MSESDSKPNDSLTLVNSAFANPGSATKSYVKSCLILTCPLDSTAPAALDDICNGTPASTSAFACLPATVSNNLIRPLTCLVSSS